MCFATAFSIISWLFPNESVRDRGVDRPRHGACREDTRGAAGWRGRQHRGRACGVWGGRCGCAWEGRGVEGVCICLWFRKLRAKLGASNDPSQCITILAGFKILILMNNCCEVLGSKFHSPARRLIVVLSFPLMAFYSVATFSVLSQDRQIYIMKRFDKWLPVTI